MGAEAWAVWWRDGSEGAGEQSAARIYGASTEAAGAAEIDCDDRSSPSRGEGAVGRRPNQMLDDVGLVHMSRARWRPGETDCRSGSRARCAVLAPGGGASINIRPTLRPVPGAVLLGGSVCAESAEHAELQSLHLRAEQPAEFGGPERAFLWGDLCDCGVGGADRECGVCGDWAVGDCGDEGDHGSGPGWEGAAGQGGEVHDGGGENQLRLDEDGGEQADHGGEGAGGVRGWPT